MQDPYLENSLATPEIRPLIYSLFIAYNADKSANGNN
jgi:hypothetical protein